MIKINSAFSIKKDPQCWELHEKQQKSNDKKGDYETIKTTYHGSIPQICEAILNKSAGECESVEELKDLFENALERIIEEVKGKVKPIKRRRS